MVDFVKCKQCSDYNSFTGNCQILCHKPVCDNECNQNGVQKKDKQDIFKRPRTIAELQEYCSKRGMPLEIMRFFIGEDYKEPRAFGIYKDGDNYVVYKNKDTGERAIRYNGPDEAFAVNEIFQKLILECRKRNIFLDDNYNNTKKGGVGKSLLVLFGSITALHVFIFLMIFFSSAPFESCQKNVKDGYYEINNEVYYHKGNSWAKYNNSENNWVLTAIDIASVAYVFIGKKYSDDVNATDISESEVWETICEKNKPVKDTWSWSSSKSDSDYDFDFGSWDSNDTDWGSDW